MYQEIPLGIIKNYKIKNREKKFSYFCFPDYDLQKLPQQHEKLNNFKALEQPEENVSSRIRNEL